MKLTPKILFIYNRPNIGTALFIQMWTKRYRFIQKRQIELTPGNAVFYGNQNNNILVIMPEKIR